MTITLDTPVAPVKESDPVEEKVTVLKPSEAFRLGRMGSPWVRGKYFDGDKSCAIGAIALATGIRRSAERSAATTRGSDD